MKNNQKKKDAFNQSLWGASLIVLMAYAESALAQQATPIPDVSVTALPFNAFTGIQAEGLASQGYKVNTATDVGPLGNMPLQDTPYSISVVPHELIENTLATSTDQIFRMNPFTQVTFPNLRNGSSYVNIRGFSVTNTLVDGLKNSGYGDDTGVIPVENLERVEVFTGLTGFLFGQADPGGTINYVLKRPTEKTFGEVTLGDAGGQSGYAHVDLGGPIDPEGKFGFRLNLAGQDGQTPVTYQREQRELYSGAFDWHITNEVLLQFDYAHSYEIEHGVPTSFNAGVFGYTFYPAAPQANVLWSQPWTYISDLTDRGGARLKWDINKNLTFRSAFNMTENTMNGGIYTAVVDNAGGLTPFDGLFPPDKQITTSEYAYLDVTFSTGPIDHKLTFGFNGTDYNDYTGSNYAQVCAAPEGAQGLSNCAGRNGFPTPFSILGSPIYVPQPSNLYSSIGYGGLQYKDANGSNNNILLGDVITLTKGLDVIVGLTRSDIGEKGFNSDGSISSSYDKSAYTPSASLVFKPVDWVTTYATYIQGLEQGEIVGPGYTNAGQALPPAIDQQYEVGTKITAGNVLYTAALFKIDKVNQYSNNALPLPTFVQDGREVHQGLEVSATGKLTEDLTLVGGVTAFSAKVEESNTASLDGLRPQNVPEVLAKAYLEYRLPFLHQVVLNGGVNFQGSYAANVANTSFNPSVVTFDLGARYETIVESHPVTFRIYATNLFDRSYFQSSGQLGDPRRIAFSGTVRF